MDLSEFLLARIAEDEAVARAATQGPWIPEDQGWAKPDGEPFIRAPYHELDISWEDVGHITRWQPARVLAEFEAKHEIASRLRAMEAGVLSRGGLDVAISELRQVCQFLALPYADHPDYREEWRP